MRLKLLAAAAAISLTGVAHGAEPMSLFRTVGPANEDLPENARAAIAIKIDRRALESPVVKLDLFDGTAIGVRDRVERNAKGEVTWVGHIEGSVDDRVIIAIRGANFSGMIQQGDRMYRLSSGRGVERLIELDLQSLPADDAAALPDGGGVAAPAQQLDGAAGDAIQQDLLVVYTQGACTAAGGCAQLEADIAVAVSDLNAAYAASNVNLTMNLAGLALTNYAGTGASQALSDLRGTSDGQMDEVHALRDSLGADIVSLIYDGEGCGIGYLPASPTSAFNVTDEPCLVGNRTMAHEIGHNQGAHHDRRTVGTSSTTTFNYGYRRCADGSVDDVGSPYFRTILAYSCTGSPRVGRFSNPEVLYSGVPQGVDPAANPANGAFNALTLNNSAAYVASFRDAPTNPEPPAAPTGLSAAATGSSSIALAWSDNASNEQNYFVQSSGDGSSWTTIAQLGANATAFSDNGLQPDTTYFYRVNAVNSAGSSAFSNVASARTETAPLEIRNVAFADNFSTGTVSGTFAATNADGGAVQSIAETGSGSKRSRQQRLTHGWSFNVDGGAGGVIFTANAWVSGGEAANFYYSTDNGASWNFMFSVAETSSATVKTYSLPGGASGLLRVEARDAEAIGGEPVDTLFVDELFVTSYTQPGTPPAAPSNMTVAGVSASSVSLFFTDNSSDEFGFEIRRASTNPNGACGAGAVVGSVGANAGTGSVAFTDMNAASGTNYWYWAIAFNGAGDNGACSNQVAATTPAAPAISAAANGRKDRGFQIVDLSWSGATGVNVDIRRNGAVVATTPNDGADTDELGVKGAGSYIYEVCNAGSATICSTPLSVVF